MSNLDNKERDRIDVAAVRSGANRSIAILEKAFIKNASGRYVVLKIDKNDPGSATLAPDMPRKQAG